MPPTWTDMTEADRRRWALDLLSIRFSSNDSISATIAQADALVSFVTSGLPQPAEPLREAA